MEDAGSSPVVSANSYYEEIMITHHTKNKGDLGVLKAKCDLYEKGWIPCQPETEHAPFDLIAWKDGVVKTISVKYREIKTDKDGKSNNSICVELKSCWADKNGTHTTRVNKEHVDILCIYCPDTNKCYYLEIKNINKSVSLNFGKPHPNKRMAYDYEIF